MVPPPFSSTTTTTVAAVVLSSSRSSFYHLCRSHLCSRKDHFLSPGVLSLGPLQAAGVVPKSVFKLRAFPSDVVASAAEFPGAGGAVIRNTAAAMAVMAGAYGLISGFDNLTQRNLIDQSLSRKLVHILSGLLFLACWPVFSNTPEARYFASLVPLANCLRLVVYGLSLATDEELIKSVTREGNPQELLRGPLYYVLILVLCAIVFWRESPIGVISLAMMCGGDGIADIMGRRFGSIKLPYNQQKSWVGSVSMFVVGFLVSLGMLYYYSALGYFQLDWICTTKRVALVSLVATVVESLPTAETVDDNISVPLASMVTAFLTFGNF